MHSYIIVNSFLINKKIEYSLYNSRKEALQAFYELFGQKILYGDTNYNIYCGDSEENSTWVNAINSTDFSIDFPTERIRIIEL